MMGRPLAAKSMPAAVSRSDPRAALRQVLPGLSTWFEQYRTYQTSCFGRRRGLKTGAKNNGKNR